MHLFTTHKSLNFSYDFFIGRTTFESKDIPQKFIDELNQMDQVHCQSTFNLKYFKKHGMTSPGYVLPNGVN